MKTRTDYDSLSPISSSVSSTMPPVDALEIGDVVELKGGGPRMTVCKTVGNLISVCWILGDASIARADFPVACLKRC